MKWKIWKSGSGNAFDGYIVVKANSFDEALAIARESDPKYDSGQVLEDKKKIKLGDAKFKDIFYLNGHKYIPKDFGIYGYRNKMRCTDLDTKETVWINLKTEVEVEVK